MLKLTLVPCKLQFSNMTCLFLVLSIQQGARFARRDCDPTPESRPLHPASKSINKLMISRQWNQLLTMYGYSDTR
jgi:hypothetical protein